MLRNAKARVVGTATLSPQQDVPPGEADAVIAAFDSPSQGESSSWDGGTAASNSAERARLVGRAEADRVGVPRGQPHRLGGGAHLLRDPVDLPGADRPRLDPRPGGRL